MTKAQKTDNVILMALAGTRFHILLNGQDGFYRDELDFIASLYVCRQPRRPWSNLWQEKHGYQ